MLLDLFEWLAGYYGGFRVFGYLTLRAIFAALTALTIALMVGPWMIRMLAARQIGQVVRDYGPDTHLGKMGTPTMGGALILVAVAAGTLLWANLSNRFVWIVLAVTLAFGLIGFYDDYLKLVISRRAGSTCGSRWPASRRPWPCGRPRRDRRRRRCTCRSSRTSRSRWAPWHSSCSPTS
jgi:phospho-N-acetylmuramoyl-pentapeptide-transferase